MNRVSTSGFDRSSRSVFLAIGFLMSVRGAIKRRKFVQGTRVIGVTDRPRKAAGQKSQARNSVVRFTVIDYMKNRHTTLAFREQRSVRYTQTRSGEGERRSRCHGSFLGSLVLRFLDSLVPCSNPSIHSVRSPLPFHRQPGYLDCRSKLSR